MDGRLQVFSGTAHPRLAQDIMRMLDAPLGRALVDQWRNGETRIRLEESVRGSDVFVIQPLCAPVNHNIMELMLLIDALKRASADRITAVIPYFAYARQEKKTTGREPISAKVVSNMLVTAGVDRVLAMDLHAPAIEGFFDIPVDHLRGTSLLARRFHKEFDLPVVAVSPDSGGVTRAENFRALTGGSLAIISKRRPSPDETEVIEMVGNVDGQPCVIVDDMISTGSTLVEAAELLAKRGAAEIYAAATHGVFAADAFERIEQSPISRVIVTDSVPIPESRRDMIEVVTIAPMLAEAIMRIHNDMSVSALFS
ncbi:MAG: ribose-phosphate pyrophosphokinase [Thermomicrobiales bacterium]|nr:ribose-phosphate pyrophosphokinase [Thermomicrobiales bacterium]